MKRRTFIKQSASMLLLGASAGPALLSARGKGKGGERLAMTTVTFLNRFEQTGGKGAKSLKGALTLMEIPEYFADRFHLHNVEFWNRHFETTDESYLKALRAKVRKTGSRLINIQLDGAYDLSDEDEGKRRASVQFVKEWIDIAEKVGSGGLRANPGKFSIGQSIQSFRELSSYARDKGIQLYVENHMGFGLMPQNMVEIDEKVNDKGLALLTDFGNFDASVDRLKGLEMLVPRTGLISAKAFYVDGEGRHPDYDFDACVQTCERMGYRGIYSAEYYDGKKRPMDEEVIADWMLERLKANIG